MSSTNRSKARDSHIADYYTTPLKPIKAFLEKFCEDEWLELRGKLILDPCAWWNEEYLQTQVDSKTNLEKEVLMRANPMSYPEALVSMWVEKDFITTNDLRKDSLATHKQDFLAMNNNFTDYDIVITNPPFNIAQNIINEALSCCKDWWYVIMLLRLNYFGGKVRQEFWKKNMPSRAYVHNKRIGFTQDWKTDSIEYAHFVWRKGCKTTETKLKIIFDFPE